MRLFVGLPLTDDAHRGLNEAVRTFPVPSPSWRWTTPPQWHITLKFIGDQEPSVIPHLTAALANAAGQARPVQLQLTGFGGFPRLEKPRVVFAQVGGETTALANLAREVDRVVCDSIGLECERRPFRPHVTLARIKSTISPREAAVLRAWKLPKPVSFSIDSFTLWESRLTPQGAVYKAVKQFAMIS